MKIATILLFVVAFCVVCAGEEIKCPDVKDVWLSSANRDESDTNGGKAPRIKLKIWQEFGLLDFDVSKLKGKRIESAALFVAPDGGAVFGKARGTDLRWFSVSTVSSEWEEGLGESYAKDEKGHGATFNEASYKTRPWTVPGSKCWDVILGNGNSLRCDVDAGDPKDGWFTIPLDKKLVEALVAGAAHGLMLMDGSTGVDRNCTISTREGKNAPYLLVAISGDDTAAPSAPGNVTITPAPNEATATQGALEISLTVPEKAFAYRVKLNGKDVPRWQIPFAAKAGTKQTFYLRYFPPDSEAKIEVVAVDAAGNASPAALANGTSSGAISVPKPPAVGSFGGASDPRHENGKIKAALIPEGIKLDPVTGRILFDKNAESVLTKNALWDERSNMAEIHAARGETASFQLVVEKLGDGPIQNIQAEIHAVDEIRPKLWLTWFVKTKNGWIPEYALPVSDKRPISIPDESNKIDGQKFALIQVDLNVSASSPSVESGGFVTFKVPGVDDINIRLNITVHAATLPAEIHFNPELNAYDEPGGAGSALFFDSHRLAQYHRCSINSVPYSQHGNMHDGVAPKVGPDGHVLDWTDYDKNLGPLLEGSAFKDNPRSGVPVAVLFLPFNENYPLAMKANYDPGCTLEGKDWKPKHDMLAKPPEQAFSKSYQDAFVNCVGDFVHHFEEKKYNRTLVEGFFNNKWSFGKDKLAGTAWVMDEPTAYLDWNALKFYSRLFHSGLKDRKNAQFIFRGDISRPMWQGSCLDGLMELIDANNEQFQMPDLMRDDKRRMPAILYAYGSANNLDRSNLETAAWCLKAYCHGCDGVVPWQSLGGDKAFDVGDSPDQGNALIVDGRKRFGVNAIASLRVHAFRQGAQLCELLRLLEIKNGWSRAQSGVFVSQLIPLGAEFKQGFADDAAGLNFGKLGADDFVRLKEAILKLLD